MLIHVLMSIGERLEKRFAHVVLVLYLVLSLCTNEFVSNTVNRQLAMHFVNFVAIIIYVWQELIRTLLVVLSHEPSVSFRETNK